MKFSVIIPVRNGGQDFSECLHALTASTRVPDEIIVVDDSSTDTSAELAKSFGTRVLCNSDGPHGPAVARNRGAEAAQGDILVFIDADVAVHRDTLSLIEQTLTAHPEIAALFGSYDDSPPKKGMVSVYKNLQHHFVHQHGKREASTFWAGAGAIRREVFLKQGGFDERYSHPSIEDIELGVRLKHAGYRIWLCPDVQVMHLKHWTLASLLSADILHRAIPWVRLILSTNQMPSDLNLDSKSRLSALMVWALLAFLALGFVLPWMWLCALAAVVVLVVLNFGLYRFFVRHGGLGFALCAFILHTQYYLYSSLVFGIVFIWHILHMDHSGKRHIGTI